MQAIHCCGDTTFKFLTKAIPELIEIIITHTTSKYPLIVKIENNEIVPIQTDGRKGAMDILCTDEEGNMYNLEMQRSPISELQILRFIYYSCSLYVLQAKSGKSIKNIRNIYTIVLSEKGINYPGLVRYDIMNCNNLIYPGIRQHLITVNMPYVKVLRNKKELTSFTSFERIIYALYYNLDDDILKIEDRTVNKMHEALIEFLQSGSFEAFQAMKDELVYQEELEKQKELKDRESDIEARESDIEARESDVEARESNIEARESNVEAREADIKSREVNIETREANIETREADIKTREADIETREADIETREADIETREAYIKSEIDIITKERVNLDKIKQTFVETIMKLHNLTSEQAEKYIAQNLN